MKLKCKNILLNSQILTGDEATMVGTKIGVGTIDNRRIYSIPPYPNAMKKSSLATENSVSDSLNDLSESQIKDINADMTNFTLLDIINWLKVLYKTDFEKYNQYVLALYNINHLITNRFIHSALNLRLCDKYSVLHKFLDKQSKSLTINNQNKTEFNQINKKISQLLKSKDKYFINSNLVSNTKLHKCIKILINNLRERILNIEIKKSNIRICPSCRHLTFSHFDFCQHCGKALD